MLMAGLALVRTDGLPGRFPREVQQRGTFLGPDVITPCVTLPPEAIDRGALCSYGPQGNDVPRAQVWGDNPRIDASARLRESGRRVSRTPLLRGSSILQPLLGFSDRTAKGGPDHCTAFNNAVVEAVRRLKPQLLILNAHWVGIDSELAPHNDRTFVLGSPHFERALRETLRQTAATGRSVCVIEDVPTYQYDCPLRASAWHAGVASRKDFLHLSRSEALAQLQESERAFRRLEQQGV